MRLNEVLKLAESAKTFCDQIFAVHGCEDGIEGFTYDQIVEMTDFCMTTGRFGLRVRFDARDEKTVVAMLHEYEGEDA